jgi:uridine kinase
VHTGYAGRDGKFKIHPDYVVPDLAAGIDWILNGHRKASLALLPLAARSLDSRLILVGGLSRSGKSSAAQVLKELLSIVGKSAHVISLDSWLKPLPKRKINGGVLDRYDLDKAREVILKITRRDTVHFVDIPIYDPFTHEPAAKGVPTRIGPSDLIILEGVPALTISCLNPLSDFKVYIETDEVTRVERIRLDYLSRGATDLEIQAILLERDLDEVPVIEESRANSDLIISM